MASFLEVLPDDILFTVLDHLQEPLVSYSFPERLQTSLDIKTALAATGGNAQRRIYFARNHPYLALSAQSRTMQAAIERYCAHSFRARKANFYGVSQLTPRRIQFLMLSWERCSSCNAKTGKRALFNAKEWRCPRCEERQDRPIVC